MYFCVLKPCELFKPRKAGLLLTCPPLCLATGLKHGSSLSSSSKLLLRLPGQYCSRGIYGSSWRGFCIVWPHRHGPQLNKNHKWLWWEWPAIQFWYFVLIILTLLYTDQVNACLQHGEPWITHGVVWQVYRRERSLFVQCTNLIRPHIKVKGIFKWYQFHTVYTQRLCAAIVMFTVWNTIKHRK